MEAPRQQYSGLDLRTLGTPTGIKSYVHREAKQRVIKIKSLKKELRKHKDSLLTNSCPHIGTFNDEFSENTSNSTYLYIHQGRERESRCNGLGDEKLKGIENEKGVGDRGIPRERKKRKKYVTISTCLE